MHLERAADCGLSMSKLAQGVVLMVSLKTKIWTERVLLRDLLLKADGGPAPRATSLLVIPPNYIFFTILNPS